MSKSNKSIGKFVNYMRDQGRALQKAPELQGKTPEECLIVVHCKEKHTHILRPDDREIAKLLLNEALEELNYFPQTPTAPTEKTVLPKRIVFHNRQAIGDILMLTAGVRDFKSQFPGIEVQVRSTAMHIWDYNPLINRESWADIIDPNSLNTTGKKPSDAEMLELNKKAIQQAIQEDRPVLVYIGPSKATNASNRCNDHFANAFRISMESALGVTIAQGPIRPDIYMSEDEYNKPPLIEPPYWLITAGEKGDWTCKTYPFFFWGAVVKAMPNMKFVQIGSPGHRHPNLKGPNVVNHIGKTEDRHTGIRDLFNLFNYCQGSMGLVSFQMHLAAGMGKACVTIAGAREPVWFTRYPGHQYLATDGCLPCTVNNKDEPTSCWFCKIERCPHNDEVGSDTSGEPAQKVPLCASLIKPEEVVNAVKHYYDGGRLDGTKPVGRSKLIRRVKAEMPEAIPTAVPIPAPKDNSMGGFAWGGASITDKDWEFMSAIFVKEKVKRVLEFGAGLSTILMKGMGIDVVSFETRQKDIDRLKKINPTLEVRLWDGTFEKAPISTSMSNDTIPEKFDLALVDGPGGGENREASFRIAAMYADKILVHDGGRAPEKKWAEKHLKPKFAEYSRGGHRTIFFKLASSDTSKIPAVKDASTPLPTIYSPQKDEYFYEGASWSSGNNHIKIVFNGRGEGGAERSVTWLANEFIEMGWDVEYITPNDKPCGTFRKEGNACVRTTNNLEHIQGHCDILLLYANDWIWEFKNLNDIFSNLQAKRRVMVVNYHLGGVGSQAAPWTVGWEKYLFLNSSLEESFFERVGMADTKFMAPPTDLSQYFDTQPNYDGNLKIVRHGSQGDAKYPKDFNKKIARILKEIPDCEIFLMPAPSFLEYPPSYNGRVHSHQRNVPPVKDFLAQGNVFWYHLPEGYTEGGPKTVMEAHASGLAVVADNHSGPKDRIINETGWLCNNFEDHLKALKHYNDHRDILELEGRKARQHAQREYDPQNWIKEIVGG